MIEWQRFFTLAGYLAGVSLHGAAIASNSGNETPIPRWEAVAAVDLSTDGRFFIYGLTRTGDDRAVAEAEVVVREVKTNSERRYPAGLVRAGGGQFQLSPSGRWLAFTIAPPASSPELSGKPNSAVSLLRLSSGKVTNIAGAEQILFTADDELILIGSCSQQHGSAACNQVRRYAPGGVLRQTLDGVEEIALDPLGRQLAWSVAGKLFIGQLPNQEVRTLDQGDVCSYKALTWSRKGNALAALKVCSVGPPLLLTSVALDTDQPATKVSYPDSWSGFPEGHAISSDPSMMVNLQMRPALAWSDDETGVFFGIRPDSSLASSRSEVSPVSNLVLWHWRDLRLPLQKAKAAELQRLTSDLSFISLVNDRYTRIETGEVRSTDIIDSGGHVLVYDPVPYDRPDQPNLRGILDTQQRRDYYLVNVREGTRTRILQDVGILPMRSLSIAPRLSPDGRVVLYQNNGDYFAYDVASAAHTNLTAGLPTTFYFPENDRNARRLRDAEWIDLSPLQGWTRDGQYVLVSDYFDVWALPLQAGRRATNLTGNGRKERVAYQLQLQALNDAGHEPRWVAPTLEEALDFSAKDLGTGRSAFVRLMPGSRQAIVRHWYFAATNFSRVAAPMQYICQRGNAVEGPDYYLLDDQRRCGRRLTRVNAKRQRPPRSRLLTYKTVHGDDLRAVLHLPLDYIPGHRYPTIVSIYEHQAELLHIPLEPSGEWWPWLERGYAVLLPDIQPRINAAVKAAVEGTSAAVDAAVATGIVDRARLGLVGHSFGGYETYAIVTQTDMFRAAVSQAGWSNALSLYGSMYERTGDPASFGVERTQPYLAGPWWDHWDAYVENSPLFHAKRIQTPLLIAHGNADKLVPFSQAVEMFNTLRRLGNKQVVLLEYDGVDHVFLGATKQDLQQRMLQFFDYFLKGEDAPVWWTDGRSYLKGGAPPAKVDVPVALHRPMHSP